MSLISKANQTTLCASVAAPPFMDASDKPVLMFPLEHCSRDGVVECGWRTVCFDVQEERGLIMT